MQIGFILYDYYPFGGLQEDCLATALATAERGHEVHLFTRTWKGPQPEEISVHLTGKRGWSNTARNEHFFADLAAVLPSFAFDGVVAFNRVPKADIYFAADPCYRARTADWPLWKRLGLRHRYYLNLERRIFGTSQPPHTLTLTQREIDAFHRHYDVPRSYFHLLPPGVAPCKTSSTERQRNRAELRASFGTPTDATVALFVGSGFRIKGLDRAIQAIAATCSRVKSLEFWIVGNGKRSQFERQTRQSGATIRFLGGRPDVDRCYDAADFLLHPAYSESAGKVLLEALTHGLPVLTTDTCGYAPHIERSGGGVVLPSPFTQAALNQAVRQLATDPNLRSSMREKALNYAATEDLYSCHAAAAERIEALLRP